MKLYLPKLGDLPAGWPEGVRVLQTQASGVTADNPYGDANLGLHVGDAPARVHSNRMHLLGMLPEVKHVQWLNQIHGTTVVEAKGATQSLLAPDADATVTSEKGLALAIMTADCMPIVLVSACGRQVAAVHAGWRGLAAGVVEAAIARMQHKPRFAWVGAYIGTASFEVGDEVKQAFCTLDADYREAFSPQIQALKSSIGAEAKANPKYLADMRLILQHKLAAFDIEATFLGADTLCDMRFYSYRRSGAHTGRMATLVYRV